MKMWFINSIRYYNLGKYKYRVYIYVIVIIYLTIILLFLFELKLSLVKCNLYLLVYLLL